MWGKGPTPGATPKADVLKHFPGAYSHHWADGWFIYSGEQMNRIIGKGGSAFKAWWHAEGFVRDSIAAALKETP